MGVIDPPRRPVGLMGDRTQARRNTLQLGRADGTYAEVGQQMHVDASDWTWCGAFIDVDLDGFEDVLVASGVVHDVQDRDTLARIQSSAASKLPETTTRSMRGSRGTLRYELLTTNTLSW